MTPYPLPLLLFSLFPSAEVENFCFFFDSCILSIRFRVFSFTSGFFLRPFAPMVVIVLLFLFLLLWVGVTTRDAFAWCVFFVWFVLVCRACCEGGQEGGWSGLEKRGDRHRKEEEEKKHPPLARKNENWKKLREKKNSNRPILPHSSIRSTTRLKVRTLLHEKYVFTLNTKRTRDGQIPSARRLCSSRDSFGSFFKRFRGRKIEEEFCYKREWFFLYNCL